MTPTRDQVVELLGRYCEAVATFDPELFASCWAADAIWVAPGDTPDHVGVDDIVDVFVALRSRYPLCVQQLLSTVMEPDDEGADVRSQVCELQWRDDGTGTELFGAYHDRVVVHDGAAVFARRAFQPRYRGPRDLPGRVIDPA